MCGIFGVIHKEIKPLNKVLFNTLGINNDSRGGDSCGIFIDNKLDYGVDKNRLYSTFMFGSTVLKEVTTCKIALGHCRKASIGKISIDTAQPVVVSKNNKTSLVVVHNGTLWNYEELADKYIKGQDIQGLTDSQVLALIIDSAGFQVLSDYIGGAAFVAVDYSEDENNPPIYMFKGKSRNSNSVNSIESEERPLYILCKKGGDIWFSSILDYLTAYKEDGDQIGTITENTLHKFTKDGVEKYQYSRENAYQSKPSSNLYTTTNWYNDYSGAGDTGWVYNSTTGEWENPMWERKNVFKSTTKKLTWISKPLSTFQNFLYQDWDCKFYELGKPLHGGFMVSSYGYLYPESRNIDKESGSHYANMWFYEGVLLYNKKCFDALNELSDYIKVTSKKFIELYADVIYLFSVYPYIRSKDVCSVSNIKIPIYIKRNQDLTMQPYSGLIYPIFCNKDNENNTYVCREGIITHQRQRSRGENWDTITEKLRKEARRVVKVKSLKEYL